MASDRPDGYVPPPAELIAELVGGSTSDLLSRFGHGVEIFDRRVFELDDEQADTAFLPDAGLGRWPVRVLLGHLADAEMVQIHRVRRTVGEEHPVFGLWDEHAFIDAGLYSAVRSSPAPALGGFVATIHCLRQCTTPWLQSLEDDAWSRDAMHPEAGRQSLRDIVAMTTWHLEHHARFLNAKVARFLGPLDDVPDGPLRGTA